MNIERQIVNRIASLPEPKRSQAIALQLSEIDTLRDELGEPEAGAVLANALLGLILYEIVLATARRERFSCDGS